MQKIQMTVPLVEMDGDEMTRVLWAEITCRLYPSGIVHCRVKAPFTFSRPMLAVLDAGSGAGSGAGFCTMQTWSL